MKVIKTGMTYEIFDNELKTFDKLPVQCYYMRFSPMKGFYLEQLGDMEIKEENYK